MRAIDIYYVVHIDYILCIGGLKPIEEGVIHECLQLQQLQAGLEPRPHRGDGHQKYARIQIPSGRRNLEPMRVYILVARREPMINRDNNEHEHG